MASREGSGTGSRAASRNGSRSASRARAKGRGRARGGTRSGPWLAAVAGFVAIAAVGGYLALHGGGAPSAAAQDAADSSASAAPPSISASAAPACAPEPADTAFATSGAKALPLDTRVTVLNGSGTFGQAEAVLNWMQNTEKFLRTSNGGPASHQATTTLVYAPNHADQARTLVAALGLPASALHGNGTARGARDPMVLTLGTDFRGVGKSFSHC
ncbi:LytR C-terminal domain-containing protein [Streptacidiphilus jiangxiensis]|nr:LytR C-terminal domain-containing protein [Streptacidiphilus jiangxiensis]